MKKISVVILAIAMLFAFVGCFPQDVVLDEIQSFEVSSKVESLYVEINAADFSILLGTEFSVQSNLKYLDVYVKDGVLCIVDEAFGNANYANAQLVVTIPATKVLKDLHIETGAGKLTGEYLVADNVELDMGAGAVHIESLFANKTCEIDGGAGEITIDLAFLHNLSVDIGAGQLNLTAQLFGNSELNFGVGEANLTLLGNKEDYTVKIDKGIGSINVEGQNVANSSTIGNGANIVDIDGGVGAINLKFQQS